MKKITGLENNLFALMYTRGTADSNKLNGMAVCQTMGND